MFRSRYFTGRYWSAVYWDTLLNPADAGPAAGTMGMMGVGR